MAATTVAMDPQTAAELARLIERTDIHTSRGMGLVKIDVNPWGPDAYGCGGATWAEAIDKAHRYLDYKDGE